MNATSVDARAPLGITELVLRDGHQSLLATRMRIDDMLPIAAQMDDIGYWSIESWGGATFDACIRYLGEDPWDRLRELKAAMPKTPQQMLLRGQNLLGYRHYADDVVKAFVDQSAKNGIDVFRIFDAMNDPRNMEVAIRAAKNAGRHAQGTLCYTLSPVHDLNRWLDLARRLEDLGCDSLCIKDMAGLLRPYAGYELVSRLKAAVAIPIHMQCHATTGLSTATYLKCIEAGIDNVDTSISSMSMTYGHSSTEAIVAILAGCSGDTGLDLDALAPIADHFKAVRKKYAAFEGELRGIDARILAAQVPGGMLTNLEHQLKEQGALDRFSEVLEEIPRVRKDLGYIPLVTPTSQIVGTQAVFNVLNGERYQLITKETEGVVKGAYGATPAPVADTLNERVLKGETPIVCRPGSLLPSEFEELAESLRGRAVDSNIRLQSGDAFSEDVLIFALFPQVGERFLTHRENADMFEVEPVESATNEQEVQGPANYHITVEGQSYAVCVGPAAEIVNVKQLKASRAANIDYANEKPPSNSDDQELTPVPAPLAGNVFEIVVSEGQQVKKGDPLLIMEAMKMETMISSPETGWIKTIPIKLGDAVRVGDTLTELVRG